MSRPVYDYDDAEAVAIITSDSGADVELGKVGDAVPTGVTDGTYVDARVLTYSMFADEVTAIVSEGKVARVYVDEYQATANSLQRQD